MPILAEQTQDKSHLFKLDFNHFIPFPPTGPHFCPGHQNICSSHRYFPIFTQSKYDVETEAQSVIEFQIQSMQLQTQDISSEMMRETSIQNEKIRNHKQWKQ